MSNPTLDKIVALVTGQPVSELQASDTSAEVLNLDARDAVLTITQNTNPQSEIQFSYDEFAYMQEAFREGVPYWAYKHIKDLEERVRNLEASNE